MNKFFKNNIIFKWLAVILVFLIIFLLLYNILEPDNITHYFSGSKSIKNERCVECHTPSSDMSSWHSYERIGCVSCHLGNPEESEKIAAHTDMISIPGNLSTARQSCGNVGCHPGITERVESSLMTSMSGVVNIQRYFFGESDTLDQHSHVKDLGYSSADSYTRNLCASCHLGREKRELGPINEKSRGGGCTACHLNYSPKAAKELEDYRLGDPMHFHPSLDLNISNDHCFGCHSRSGRISTSYEGWHESQLKSIPTDKAEEYRKLEDKRIFVQLPSDVHHDNGILCIDCHSGMEVMGDGRKYYHAEEAVRIRCSDCHFNEAPQTVAYEDLDYESQKIVDVRETLDEKMRFVIGKISNYPLVNVIQSEEDYFMIGKISGKKMKLSPQDPACSRGSAHDDLSCSACHSAWAPQCIKCHVDYDPNRKGFDLLARETIQGKWIEKGGHFLAELATLGVMEKRQANGVIERKIETFVPGMILEADPSAYTMAEDKNKRFARLFAPIEAHTTTKKARDCKSCHLSSLAIGYGRGKLSFDQLLGGWSFDPLYPLSKQDKLPEDAWIALFKDPVTPASTRSNGRPFNKEEQKRILTVGICLECHADDSSIMLKSLESFEVVLKDSAESEDCPFD